MDTPKTFNHNQPAREFWRWAKKNEPRHRDLQVRFLPIKGKMPKVKTGDDISFWKKLLDFLVKKGWPEYAIIWTVDKKLVVFERYLLQEVKNAIQRNQIR